ncbi:GNAT family N-acetyltransferase [Xylanimonas oleitrophica]|uniref:GNAT family N-acetyltransferase n=1 Tax=Xylanimonas oleitrophica TaxID=2607479 RepID=A0A2W5X046_9MICO|nr:GNAT family protein [Xylanimonas oleitrophica]PZR53585.1 GNAT family N-acetyltransferase [Xylanimonas oleitrophica]
MIHDLVLAGHGVRLEPLAVAHAPALHALVDDALWAGMTSPRPTTPDGWAQWVAAQQADPARVAFAVVSDGGAADGQVRGSTSFYELSHAQRRVEIGTTFYGRAWWGTTNNPACKLLLLGHAFEEWGMQRVALRADARNVRSCAAIQRLGARPEGVLRKHRVAADGSTGDTAYFSVLDDEWPAVRAGLEARLA